LDQSVSLFCLTRTSPDQIYTLSLHDALPIYRLMTEYQIRRLPVVENGRVIGIVTLGDVREAEPSDATSLSVWEMNYLLAKQKISDRKSTRLNSSHVKISYAVFCLKKKKKNKI